MKTPFAIIFCVHLILTQFGYSNGKTRAWGQGYFTAVVTVSEEGSGKVIREARVKMLLDKRLLLSGRNHREKSIRENFYNPKLTDYAGTTTLYCCGKWSEVSLGQSSAFYKSLWGSISVEAKGYKTANIELASAIADQAKNPDLDAILRLKVKLSRTKE